MKFQKTLLASLIFVATTAAWAQTAPASQPASQPASDPNADLPNRAVTWPELNKVLNGEPNSTDEAQKLGVWGAMMQGFDETDKVVSKLKEDTLTAFKELLVAANNDNDAQDEEIAKKADKTEVEGLAGKVKQAFEMLAERLPEEFDAKADKTALTDLETELKAYARKYTDEAFGLALSDSGQDVQDLERRKLDKSAFSAFYQGDFLGLVNNVNGTLHGDQTAEENSPERKGVIGVLNEKADKTEVTTLDTKWTNIMGGFAEELDNRLDAKADKTDLDKKADKVSVDVVKKQLAGVAITTYKLDKQITDLAEQAGTAVETLNANMLDLSNTTVAMIADLAQAAEDDNQAQNVEIAKKADKAVVDDLIAKHNEAGTKLTAFVEHVNDSFEQVNESFVAVETELGKKADKTVVDDLIAKHNEAGTKLTAFVEHVNDSFEQVNESFVAVETELGKKADKTEVQAVDAKVETLATNAQTAVDTLAQATRDLATATDRELTGLKDKNTEMSGKLEATEARVTNVEAVVRNLGTTQISALDARISANSDRINGLNTRVNQLSKELKRGMASQAALSGLFQPYNVGKVNITAAVGGYKSATAVAIGAGYRVNNKFAAKAGVAFSAGSPAYNVGINYEF
ncbi:MAG: YadA-like family protein [Pasteurellaceae bacterium]|nr:YadA-like family protein [Pasteurellaceae bacterium]